MVVRRAFHWILYMTFSSLQFCLMAQQAGSVRGVIYDKDFNIPLAGATVTIAESGEKQTTSEEGNYVFSQVAPGKYTIVFSKDGYSRQVRPDVLVSTGKLTELD